MTKFPYWQYDGFGLTELINKKEISKEELLEATIERIENINPTLNAVIHKMYEQGRKQLSQATGPFSGIPTLLKDITQEMKGEPMTSGSKANARYIADRDSEYVARIKNTGSIILGITNVPEFALMGVTEPEYYGPTKNPWNMSFTPGGSSGGAAAAVASGMVPFAGANDGGGSIRIPAAYCGLFGLKPTRGRTPVGSKFGRHWQGASVDHMLTRSVRDSALLLDLTKGYEKGAAFHAPPYDTSYFECINKPFKKKLKIAFNVESPIGTDVHPECEKAVFKTVKLLEQLGHDVVEKKPPVDGKKIAKAYITLYFGEVAALLRSLEGFLGRKVTKDDVELTTWLLGRMGKVTSAEEWVLYLQEWDKAAFLMEEFHETYDLYMTPTTAYPPAKIGELSLKKMEKTFIKFIDLLHLGSIVKKSGFIDQLVENSLKRTPFTQLANLTGQPAMSVPIHKTREGLPVGVQFIAARGREDILFPLAAQLEKTDHWIDIQTNPFFLTE